MIQNYFDRVRRAIAQYTAADFVLNTSFHFEVRPGDQGYFTGVLNFINGSELHFTEFLDVIRRKCE